VDGGSSCCTEGGKWDQAVAEWRDLPSDEGAEFDAVIELNAHDLVPMITYGTNPGMGMKITDNVPDPDREKDVSKKMALDKALTYMGLQPGQSLLGKPVDVVFLGSCTNSRIGDLRIAAAFMKGRKVSENIRMMVVPGSQQVKKQAESEGLDVIFKEAGAEWREAGSF
jgi:3-isopropylmalate/(R)-2-methylmalate dehydratase large subunit